MTYKGFIVTLSDNIREDDAEAIINALHMIKGVVDVSPVCANAVDDRIIRLRVWHELTDKVFRALENP